MSAKVGPSQAQPHEQRIRVDHCSLPVGDLDDAIGFYEEVVGLERIQRPDFDFPGAWFLAGTTPVHLTTGGTLRGPEAPLRPNEAHLAFCVDEGLETLLTRLRTFGAPVYELENSPAAERQVFVLDPWGNMLELCRYRNPSAVDARG
jgi:catechol 2,3-dioxygenase-like lactoylglutathione lyase family enzyme